MITYKILVDPNTFKPLLTEIIINEPFGTGMQKRRMEPEELLEWTAAEFTEKLTEPGYGTAIAGYIKEYNIKFKI